MLSVQDLPKNLKDLSPFNKIRLLQLAREYDEAYPFLNGVQQVGEPDPPAAPERLAYWDKFLEEHPAPDV